ncbi:MAG TPA: hypothetical protein VFL83_23085 [Anaeromyxobacter sp.]|nr:hypothetical protein [Anaeromyxobacter sp.]
MHRVLASLSLAVLAAGCAGPHPWSRTALCEMDRAGGGAEPGASDWARLLLRGWDAETGRATSPAVDCTGTQVRWEGPALACDDGSTARAVLPDRPLGPEDLVVTPLEGRTRLVWIVTNRYASGDGLGPAAVVEVYDQRLVVRAIGAIRANVVRARLRLEPLAATEALVAEGERCGSADPASCERAVRVVPLVRDRFLPTRVETPEGGCASPAWFWLGREESEKLPSGWRRRTRLDGAITFGPPGFAVDEQVAVHDLDPRQPNAPPRPFRKAESRLEVTATGGRLVTTGSPLWHRVKAASE